jgi:hypothetical protein
MLLDRIFHADHEELSAGGGFAPHQQKYAPSKTADPADEGMKQNRDLLQLVCFPPYSACFAEYGLGRKAQLQKLQGAYPNALNGHFPMQMGACAAASIAHQPDHFTLQHHLAGHHKHLAEMVIVGEDPPTMIDDHTVAMDI